MSEKKAVLFVDDEQNVTRSYERLMTLYDADVEIYSANGMKNAVRLFRENNQITLVVSDFNMLPDGNGNILYDNIKDELEARKGTFVLITGADPDTVRPLFDRGVAIHQKPIGKETLFTIVNDAVDG